jgi:hypothetical protein
MKQTVFFLILIFAVSSAAVCAEPVSSADLLRRTAKSVEDFWSQLEAVNCVETVDQQKLNPDGKVLYRQESKFDYLAVLQSAGRDLIVNESRMPLGEAAEHGKNLPLLITNGFSTLEFIFHSSFQGEFEYSAPETVQVDGKYLQRVQFRHVRGARSPSVLKLRQREYPVEWQGTAWIEPDTGAIVRITAGLMSSMEDLGLKALNADARYGPVRFSEDSQIHWLPSVATIEVETVRQRWRNIHTFTNYRLFSVDVKTKVEDPK